MELHVKDPDLPDVSAEQRASNEMTKLIRKLRWMGMENEAERIRSVLKSVPHLDAVMKLSEAD